MALNITFLQYLQKLHVRQIGIHRYSDSGICHMRWFHKICHFNQNTNIVSKTILDQSVAALKNHAAARFFSSCHISEVWLLNWCWCVYLTHIPLEKMATIFADDIFKCIFMNEVFCISIKISLKFVPEGPIDNKSVLVQVMVLCQTAVKPLPEPMLTHMVFLTKYYNWVCK